MQTARRIGVKDSYDAAMIAKEGKWMLNFWKINFQAWTAEGKLEIVKRKLFKMCAVSEMKRPVMEINSAKTWIKLNFDNDK